MGYCIRRIVRGCTSSHASLNRGAPSEGRTEGAAPSLEGLREEDFHRFPRSAVRPLIVGQSCRRIVSRRRVAEAVHRSSIGDEFPNPPCPCASPPGTPRPACMGTNGSSPPWRAKHLPLDVARILGRRGIQSSVEADHRGQVRPAPGQFEDRGPAETVPDRGQTRRIRLRSAPENVQARPRRVPASASGPPCTFPRARPPPSRPLPGPLSRTCRWRTRRTRAVPAAPPVSGRTALWPNHSCATTTPGRFPWNESSYARYPSSTTSPCRYSTTSVFTSARAVEIPANTKAIARTAATYLHHSVSSLPYTRGRVSTTLKYDTCLTASGFPGLDAPVRSRIFASISPESSVRISVSVRRAPRNPSPGAKYV